MNEFLNDVATRCKPATLRLYRSDLANLSSSVGSGLPAAELTDRHLSAWLEGMKVKPTTKAIMLRSTAAMLNWAVRHRWLTENVARLVAKPKGRSRSREAVISEADHRRLLEAATDSFRPVLEVLHGTGCRPGEAAALTVENTDFTTGVAVLDSHKSERLGKPRLIFLPPAVGKMLAALGRDRGPLLRTAKGNPWTGRSITQAMRRACAEVCVKAIAYGGSGLMVGTGVSGCTGGNWAPPSG